MRFLIDVHHIGARATGNETWSLEVMNGLSRVVRAAPPSDELIFALADAPTSVSDPRLRTVRTSRNPLQRLLWDLPRSARRDSVDATLVQYTSPLTSLPVVVAIHDLSFAHAASRDWIPRAERARMRASIRWSAQRAEVIVALSEHTAQDLRTKWQIDPRRIMVAHPAVGSDRARRLQMRASRRPAGGPKVLLAVGNVLPRKNLGVLARATEILRRRKLEVELHVVGQVPAAGRSVREDVERIAGRWTRFSGYADEDGLVAAYHSADVFCFPSLFEGFGLPVLEAMTAGVPTVVSDASALPEAAGDAGALVDPSDADGWADAIERILADDELAADMIERGRAHAAGFDWTSTASTVLSALRNAAA